MLIHFLAKMKIKGVLSYQTASICPQSSEDRGRVYVSPTTVKPTPPKHPRSRKSPVCGVCVCVCV